MKNKENEESIAQDLKLAYEATVNAVNQMEELGYILTADSVKRNIISPLVELIAILEDSESELIAIPDNES